jgi:flagellar basal-body rod protein FlgC
MKTEGLFHALHISASGLRAEMERLRTAAANIANVHTTRTPEGGPYAPRRVVLAAQDLFGRLLRQAGKDARVLGGVQVQQIAADRQSPPRLAYDPHHPDADERGMVAYPPIDVPTEMVDVLSAGRAYEANVAALEAAKKMMDRALDI